MGDLADIDREGSARRVAIERIHRVLETHGWERESESPELSSDFWYSPSGRTVLIPEDTTPSLTWWYGVANIMRTILLDRQNNYDCDHLVFEALLGAAEKEIDNG
jgi:hypothetical protein